MTRKHLFHMIGYGYVLLSVLCWSLLNIPLLIQPVAEFHHELEYFGALPVFLNTSAPYLHNFFIHGIGVDGLASYFGYLLSSGDNTIMMTRVVRCFQGIVASLGCFYVLWELIPLHTRIRKDRFIIFAFLASAFLFLNDRFHTLTLGGALYPPSRQALFTFQIALLMRAIRTESFIAAIISGLLLLPGLAYNHSYGGFFFACNLGFLFLLTLVQPKASNLLKGILVGLATGFVLGSLLFGYQQIFALFEQVYLLGRYGKLVQSPQHIPFLQMSLAAGTLAFAFLFLLKKKKQPESIEFKQLISIVFLFVLGFLNLDYGMHSIGHWMASAMAATFLFFSLLIFNFDKLPEHSIWRKRVIAAFCLFSITWAVLNISDISPVRAWNQVKHISYWSSTIDEKLIPEVTRNESNAISKYIKEAPCVFPTMNSDLIFNYVFNKISCSRFGSGYQVLLFHQREQWLKEVQNKKSILILVREKNNDFNLNELKQLFKTEKLVSYKDLSVWRLSYVPNR